MREQKAREAPGDIPVFEGELTLNDDGQVCLAAFLHEAGLANSAGEGRRLIDGGGVKINDVPVPPKAYNIAPSELQGAIIKVGKRKFLQIPSV